ncbi:MAG: hypothetical protein J6U54_13990 [Clostridiales bacterium]|nr:hypothetical protein [Clostridiales bacterium]
MFKIKKQVVVLLVLCLSLCFNGCSKQKDTDSAVLQNRIEQAEIQEVTINSDSLFYQMALIDNKILYTEINGQKLDFVLEDPDGQQMRFGSVPNFLTSMKQVVLNYPYVYHYICVVEGDDTTRNCLVKLNLETGEKVEFVCNDESIPTIPAYYFNGCIVTYKNIVTEDQIYTFLDSFNVETETWEKHMECTIDTVSGKGEAIYGICSNQNNLYVLHDICESKIDFNSYLEVLNTDYEIIKTIEISKEMHEFVLSSFVSDMDVFGDYIYFFNASMYGYLAKIENDELIEVFKGRDFALAKNVSSSAPLFYTRGTNKVYSLDDDEKLSEIDLEVGNEHLIQTVFVSGELCYIIFYGEEINAYSYLVERECLENVKFPCSENGTPTGV